MEKLKQFAAAGSCSATEKIIVGKVVDKNTFISEEFTGKMNSQKFWDDLREYAKINNCFVKLMY